MVVVVLAGAAAAVAAAVVVVVLLLVVLVLVGVVVHSSLYHLRLRRLLRLFRLVNPALVLHASSGLLSLIPFIPFLYDIVTKEPSASQAAFTMECARVYRMHESTDIPSEPLHWDLGLPQLPELVDPSRWHIVHSCSRN